jgi:hypothetical protein
MQGRRLSIAVIFDDFAECKKIKQCCQDEKRLIRTPPGIMFIRSRTARTGGQTKKINKILDYFQ